jgi:hypothetical protein
MPLSTGFNVPPWNKRRWVLFKKFISQPSVVEAVARYQREGYINTNSYPLWAYGGIVDNYLPDGCNDAYTALLNTPEITDQELANLIKPPIEIISHTNKHFGLVESPGKAYENYMHRIGADDHPEDVDPLFEDDTSLYLRIAPHTNPTEIKAFITKYYDKEMWPHLQTQPVWDTKQSKSMDDRNSKTRQAVGDNEPIKHRILALHGEGKKSPEITSIIDDEFKKYIDQAYVRKIISDNKQR